MDKILKQFDQIEFNEKYHTYKLNGKRLKSVSSLVKKITPPFDRDFMATKIAAKMTRQGNPTTFQELIVAWEEKGEKSRNLGTLIHLIISNILSGEIRTNVHGWMDIAREYNFFNIKGKAESAYMIDWYNDKDIDNKEIQKRMNVPNGETYNIIPITVDPHCKKPLIGFDSRLAEYKAFKNYWRDGKDKYKIVGCEIPIGDTDLFGGVAGTIDLMVLNKETGIYHIVDWKTGKMDIFDIWGNLFPPFNYLDKSHINKYSIQLGMYKKILGKNTGIKFGDSFIVHLGKDGEYNEYTAKDFDNNISEWSESYE